MNSLIIRDRFFSYLPILIFFLAKPIISLAQNNFNPIISEYYAKLDVVQDKGTYENVSRIAAQKYLIRELFIPHDNNLFAGHLNLFKADPSAPPGLRKNKNGQYLNIRAFLAQCRSNKNIQTSSLRIKQAKSDSDAQIYLVEEKYSIGQNEEKTIILRFELRGDKIFQIRKANDADRDLVEDEQDTICPNTPYGLFVNWEGCPDRDHDRIRDSFDQCHDHPNGITVNQEGCPDEDLDGVVDRLDDCPGTKENEYIKLNQKGCPDDDLDGIKNELDQCPESDLVTHLPEDINEIGCIDHDRDGFYPDAPLGDSDKRFDPEDNNSCDPILHPENCFLNRTLSEITIATPFQGEAITALKFCQKQLYISSIRGTFGRYDFLPFENKNKIKKIKTIDYPGSINHIGNFNANNLFLYGHTGYSSTIRTLYIASAKGLRKQSHDHKLPKIYQKISHDPERHFTAALSVDNQINLWEKEFFLWELPDKKLYSNFKSKIIDICFLKDHLIAIGESGEFQIWNHLEDKVIASSKLGRVNQLDFVKILADGKYIIGIEKGKLVGWKELETNKFARIVFSDENKTLKQFKNITDVDLSEDENYLFLGDVNGRVIVYQIKD